VLDPYLLTLHGLTLRQLADAAQLADVIGLDPAEVEEALGKAVADGAVLAARGSHMITPAGRERLDAAYPEVFAELRADPAVAEAMERFETGVNKQVLTLTTDWQTVEVDGERVANDHSDTERDAAIVDKLHAVVERTGRVLAPLVERGVLVDRFLDRLGAALTRVEAGETDHVSGVRVDSVHTVWFQMHEHVLRLTGRERPE
jgi:hypothetical protein